MKQYLMMLGATGLLAGMLIVGGCGDDAYRAAANAPAVTTTTAAPAATTTTAAPAVTTTTAAPAATTTTAAPAATTTTAAPPVTTTTAGPAAVALDGQGTASVPVTLSAASGAVNFIDTAATANNVIITGFGADDKILVTGATSAQYDTVISSNAAGDVTINYNNNGTQSKIVLQGLITNGGFVYNVASFNALNKGLLLFP
jgi:hypothetical protein